MCKYAWIMCFQREKKSASVRNVSVGSDPELYVINFWTDVKWQTDVAVDLFVLTIFTYCSEILQILFCFVVLKVPTHLFLYQFWLCLSCQFSKKSRQSLYLCLLNGCL